MPFNMSLSIDTARMIDAQRRDCFRNSLKAQFVLDKPDAPVLYCEGWAVVQHLGIPMEHGWCELSDGSIVDVTPLWISTGETNLYVPTRRYTAKESLRRIAANAKTPYIVFYDKLPKEHIDTMQRLLDKSSSTD